MAQPGGKQYTMYAVYGKEHRTLTRLFVCSGPLLEGITKLFIKRPLLLGIGVICFCLMFAIGMTAWTAIIDRC
jgi:hypothetical protein